MVKCIDCGLLDKDKKKGIYICVRFEKEIPEEKSAAEIECGYYLDNIFEDGEPLSPRQHLIMQEGERRSRKMRGPI